MELLRQMADMVCLLCEEGKGAHLCDLSNHEGETPIDLLQIARTLWDAHEPECYLYMSDEDGEKAFSDMSRAMGVAHAPVP